MSQLKQKIRELIGQGKLDEIFQELAKHFNDNDEILLLKNQYTNLEGDKSNGIINYSEFEQSRNKITTNLLNLVKNLEAKELIPKEKEFIPEKHFTIKKGEELEAEELLKTRALPQNGFDPEFYLSRKIDADLLNKVTNLQNVIITGKPLAGKTRAIYQLIKRNFSDRNILIPQKEDLKEEALESLKNWLSTINGVLVLDEIDQWLFDSNWLSILETILLNPQLLILGTCRIDKEKRLKRELEDFEFLRIQSLVRLSKEEKELLANYSKDASLDKNKIDVIGSLIMPIRAMGKIYHQKIETKRNEREILRSYKILFFSKLNTSGDKTEIRNYLNKRLEIFYNKKTIKEEAWVKALQKLERNALIINDVDKIFVDDFYLYSFIDKDQSFKDYVDEITDYYPTVITYNKLIHKISYTGFDDFLLKKMKQKGIQPDEFTFNSLINKTSNFEQAEKLLQIMDQKGIIPNKITIICLLNSCTSKTHLDKVSEIMTTNNIQSNNKIRSKIKRIKYKQ